MAGQVDAIETVGVVGAGIVGVCCALYLQKAGFRVSIFDPNEPGSQCSFGAAGNFGGNAHFAMRDILWSLPKMLLDPQHPFEMRFRDIPLLLPWIRRYIAGAEPTRQFANSRALGALSRNGYEQYLGLLTEAGEPTLIRKNGRFFVWTSEKGFRKDQHALELRRERGIELEMLSGDEVRAREPTISLKVLHGAYAPNAGFILNPLRLTRLLAEHVAERGGVFRREKVHTIEFEPEGRPRLVTDSGVASFNQVVLAAGIWSREIAASIGSVIPLVPERGYHAMLPDPGIKPAVSTLWEERKVIFTPMEHGLRASGIAEFAAKEAPPRYELADRLTNAAQELFPGVQVEGVTRWMGPRPVTPDYLPVIGRSPRHPSIIFAFGHGHSGYNLGPPTGDLVAQIARHERLALDVHAFRPDRWQ